MLGFRPLSTAPLSSLLADSASFLAAWTRHTNSFLDGETVMQKNTAGQKIGAQLVSATDGSAFTSSVTVYVCGDAGTQAVGSVGSGVCTHEGNGYHTYAPAQAETNYDLIAFTFIGTGAVPATVQVATAVDANVTKVAGTSQTAGDLAAMITAVDDYVDTEIAAIKAKTDNLPASPANEATLTTIASYIDTEVAAIKAKTDNLPTDPADASDIAASFTSIANSLATLSGYVDTEVAAIKAKTDSLTFTVAGQIDANIQSVNDVTVTGTGAVGDEWGP